MLIRGITFRNSNTRQNHVPRDNASMYIIPAFNYVQLFPSRPRGEIALPEPIVSGREEVA